MPAANRRLPPQLMAAAAHPLSEDGIRDTVLRASDEDSIMQVIIDIAEQRAGDLATAVG